MIEIRAATGADRQAAWQVWHAANVARRGGVPASEDIQELVRERLAEAGAWQLLAEDGSGRVVGMTSSTDGREDDGRGSVIPGLCHINMVFVMPDAWGEGIGSQLVDATLAEARRRGFSRAQLWTHEDNERAQRLYRGRGFRHSERLAGDDEGKLIGLWVRQL